MVLLLDCANPGYLRTNSFDPEIFTASICGIYPQRNPVFLCRTAIRPVSGRLTAFLAASPPPLRRIGILELSGMKNPE
jgi:hypothetical protein